MGTRSLLAVETTPGVVHSQYMQFDGYPTCKGKDFYERVACGFGEASEYFTGKARRGQVARPNDKFAKLAIDFLNNYQYQTGHSIGANSTLTMAEWEKADSWQEWQYVFLLNGDFVAFHVSSASRKALIIPWELTRTLVNGYASGRSLGFEKGGANESVLKQFWDSLERHLQFNPEYAEEGEKQPPEPVLKVKAGEVLAHPEQKAGGWRDYVAVEVDGKPVPLARPGLEEYKGRRRRRKTYGIRWADRAEALGLAK
jgi:hypothetical protein